jgi:hypothetical protein
MIASAYLLDMIRETHHEASAKVCEYSSHAVRSAARHDERGGVVAAVTRDAPTLTR